MSWFTNKDDESKNSDCRGETCPGCGQKFNEALSGLIHPEKFKVEKEIIRVHEMNKAKQTKEIIDKFRSELNFQNIITPEITEKINGNIRDSLKYNSKESKILMEFGSGARKYAEKTEIYQNINKFPMYSEMGNSIGNDKKKDMLQKVATKSLCNIYYSEFKKVYGSKLYNDAPEDSGYCIFYVKLI